MVDGSAAAGHRVWHAVAPRQGKARRRGRRGGGDGEGGGSVGAGDAVLAAGADVRQGGGGVAGGGAARQPPSPEQARAQAARASGARCFRGEHGGEGRWSVAHVVWCVPLVCPSSVPRPRPCWVWCPPKRLVCSSAAWFVSTSVLALRLGVGPGVCARMRRSRRLSCHQKSPVI